MGIAHFVLFFVIWYVAFLLILSSGGLIVVGLSAIFSGGTMLVLKGIHG